MNVKVGDPATPLHGTESCDQVDPGLWVACTEPVGHDGPHIACGGSTVLAVWS